LARLKPISLKKKGQKRGQKKNQRAAAEAGGDGAKVGIKINQVQDRITKGGGKNDGPGIGPRSNTGGWGGPFPRGKKRNQGSNAKRDEDRPVEREGGGEKTKTRTSGKKGKEKTNRFFPKLQMRGEGSTT